MYLWWVLDEVSANSLVLYTSTGADLEFYITWKSGVASDYHELCAALTLSPTPLFPRYTSDKFVENYFGEQDSFICAGRMGFI